MEIDAFLSQVANEPERTVTRTVWTLPPEIYATAARPGGIRMTDLITRPGRRSARRDFRYRHILGPPASQQMIDAWQADRPSHPLPGDLRVLLRRINGVHLWADVEVGRSYSGLAPIEEWELARIKMYGDIADQSLLDDRYLAISYHQDNASFIVLDVASGKYSLMEASGPDTTSPIASNAEELLDWLWRYRISLKE